MSRQIKFRIWDRLEQKYIIQHSGNREHYIMTLNGIIHNLQNGSGGEDYVVEQFTGMHDKNGVEIYEGDVINYSNSRDHLSSNMNVVWVDRTARFKLMGKSYTFDLYNVNDYNGIREVVGNVHQNSKLL